MLNLFLVPFASLTMSTVSLGIASGIATVATTITTLRPDPKDMTYYKCRENPKNTATVPAVFCTKLPNTPFHIPAQVTQNETIVPVCPYQPEFMKREAVCKKLRKEGVVTFQYDIEFVE